MFKYLTGMNKIKLDILHRARPNLVISRRCLLGYIKQICQFEKRCTCGACRPRKYYCIQTYDVFVAVAIA